MHCIYTLNTVAAQLLLEIFTCSRKHLLLGATIEVGKVSWLHYRGIYKFPGSLSLNKWQFLAVMATFVTFSSLVFRRAV